MNMSLTGKWALVGGSSKGIGLATAQVLGAMGASVILTGRDRKLLEDAQRTLKTPSLAFEVDFQSRSSIEQLLSEIEKLVT